MSGIADVLLRPSNQHSFVVTFENEQARDYYVNEDPAHIKFKELAGQHVEKVFVFDFEAGVF